jgi:hypothetical protein
MKLPLQSRVLLLTLALPVALLGQIDAREIIRRAAVAEEINWNMARKYIFSERVNLRYMDSKANSNPRRSKSTMSRCWTAPPTVGWWRATTAR